MRVDADGDVVGLLPSREAFEGLGFRLGPDAAVDVTRALPAGWFRGEGTGRYLDERGRPRTRAVGLPCGTTDALSLVPRYEVRTVDATTREVAHLGLAEGRACVAVLDAGRPVRHSAEFDLGDARSEETQTTWMRQWLDSEYPENRDPTAYWAPAALAA